MSDHTDLVARLRHMASDTTVYDLGEYWNVCDDAADALEAAAERERELEAMVRSWKEQTTYARAGSLENMERAERAEAECAAWRRTTADALEALDASYWGLEALDDERFREADKSLRRLLSTPAPGAALLGELAQAKAENVRLRESLHRIEQECIARRALEETK